MPVPPPTTAAPPHTTTFSVPTHARARLTQRCPPSHRLDNRRSTPSDKLGFPGYPRNLHAPFWTQVRRQLLALAYNLGNFLRRLASPEVCEALVADDAAGQADQDWCEGSHARYVIFQMAEVAIPRRLFAAILEPIRRLPAVQSMAPS